MVCKPPRDPIPCVSHPGWRDGDVKGESERGKRRKEERKQEREAF